MDTKTTQEGIPQNWAFYYCNIEDQLAIMRINLALGRIEIIESHKYCLQFTVKVNEPNEHGFADNSELDQKLYIIEDNIVQIIEQRGGIFSGICQNDGLYNLYFLIENGEGIEEILHNEMSNFAEYKFGMKIQEDPEWSNYFDFLYPNDYEYQTIMNQSVIAGLAENGNNPELDREVDHFLYFNAENDRDKFIKAVEKLGYKILSTDKKEDDEAFPFAVHIMRNDNTIWHNMNEYVWELVVLAKENGGLYDGWGCPIAN